MSPRAMACRAADTARACSPGVQLSRHAPSANGPSPLAREEANGPSPVARAEPNGPSSPPAREETGGHPSPPAREETGGHPSPLPWEESRAPAGAADAGVPERPGKGRG